MNYVFDTPLIKAATVVGHLEVHAFDQSYRVDFYRNDRPQQPYRCAWAPSLNSARDLVQQYEVK
jgi:hypothetical protein